MTEHEREIEELFAEIGAVVVANKYLGVDFVHDKDPTPADFGKGWFYTHLRILKTKFCSESFRKKADSLQGDTGELVTVLADVISAVVVAVPPFTVARLILKIGIHKLCAFPTGPDEATEDTPDD